MSKIEKLLRRRRALCERILSADSWRARLMLQEVVDKLKVLGVK